MVRKGLRQLNQIALLSPAASTRENCPTYAEFGAWYARFNFNSRHVHKPWVRYQRDMHELFTKRLSTHPAAVLWRSYGPSHFGGMTGTYTGDTFPQCPGCRNTFCWRTSLQG